MKNLRPWIFLTFAFLLGIALVLSFVLIRPNKQLGTAVEIHWKHLGELNYMSDSLDVPKKLKDLNGFIVKIPGFMVPLEDSVNEVTEFLLVPTPQACIHVPPPPPNQMVYVKMTAKRPVSFGPIWVYGKLNISTFETKYGNSSFQLEGQEIEDYKY